MATVGELAKLVRSKNAGPFTLVIDVMFKDPQSYQLAVNSEQFEARTIADIFGLPVEAVKVMYYEPALAVKIALPRPTVSGDPGDGDVLGGQQYAPIADIALTTRASALSAQ